MATYKAAHDALVAGIGTADQYAADWKAIATDLNKLVVSTGFDPKGKLVPELIRSKLAGAPVESTVLRGAAKAAVSDVGTAGDLGKKRALALKTLRHLYYFESFGKQRVWILNLPGSLDGFPMEYASASQGMVDAVLDASGEHFDATAMKDLSETTQSALAWVQAAMIVVGSPLEHQHRKLIRRWFVPEGTKDETAKVTATAAAIRPELQKIAAGLKSGSIILTDQPEERGTGSDLENSEAFVYNSGDLTVVYVEKEFFGTVNTLGGKANWTRILVHELTHLYAKTKDHSYSWQGLLPRDTDVLKKGEDALAARYGAGKAVRTLTMDQCRDNADSWAFFIADCAGALTLRDRIQALGVRTYDLGGESVEVPLAEKLNIRAGG